MIDKKSCVECIHYGVCSWRQKASQFSTNVQFAVAHNEDFPHISDYDIKKAKTFREDTGIKIDGLLSRMLYDAEAENCDDYYKKSQGDMP